jgi:peptidoglycan/LPS O-acetylase OafA/YrhL
MDIKYRPEIDGLRAIAVLAVVFYHADYGLNGNELFSGGYIGVDIFFVISGYLITSIIYKGLKQGDFSFARFYERRVRRILPALFTVLLTCLVFAIIFLIPWQLSDFAMSALASLFFVSNIYFWKESGYFAPATDELPLLHTWSLAIEEQFYILFPICLLLVWKYLPRYLLVTMIVALSLSFLFAESVTAKEPEYSFYLLNTRMWELLSGAILAKLELDRGRNNPAVLELIMPLLGLLLIGFAIFNFDSNSLHPGYITIIPILGAMLMIWYCKPGGWLTDKLSYRPVVFTGLISYSLYLWHFPIFAFSNIINLSLNNLHRTAFIAISVLLSLLSYHFIEQPFRRKTFAFRKVAKFCTSSAIILLISMILVFTTDGGLGRYRAGDLTIVSTTPDEFGEYVNGRFSEYQYREFDESGKLKIMLIGDSYGKDLLNALTEIGLIDTIQLSTHSIVGQCGNLFLDRDLSDLVADNYQTICEAESRYEDPRVLSIMRDADIVWLASSWRLWQAELLPESLENISAHTDARILVLGRKDFGRFSIQEIISMPPNERVNFRKPVSGNHWETNEQMRTSLDEEIFIDLQRLFCNGMQTCPIFNDESNLISYDGNHLTPSGAKYLGKLLVQELRNRGILLYEQDE